MHNISCRQIYEGPNYIKKYFLSTFRPLFTRSPLSDQKSVIIIIIIIIIIITNLAKNWTSWVSLD